MFSSTRIFLIFINVLLTAVCFNGQIPTKFAYDETNGQITGVFYLDGYNDSSCAQLKPVIGTVIKEPFEGNNDEDGIGSLSLKTVKGMEFIDFILLSEYPPHIRENLKRFFLKKGNVVKVWRIACGSGGFIYATHIAKVQKGSDLEKIPEIKESILEQNPYEAIENFKKVRQKLEDKLEEIRNNFDKEIAPNISNEPKGEFETTAEANARLSKLQQLRTVNISKLWKKIYLETHELVNEYLRILFSYYSSPINITLGKYDADMTFFPVVIEGKEVSVYLDVPRNIAPTLKQNFNRAKVFVDYELFNVDEKKVSPTRIRVVFDGKTFIGTGYSDLLEYKP